MAQHTYLPPGLRRIVRETPWLQRVFWALEAAPVLLVWGILWMLPTDVASRAAGGLMRRLGPRIGRSALMRRNLEIALADRTPEEIDALLPGVWSSWGSLFAEVPHRPRIAASADRRIETAIEGDAEALRKPGRPRIFVTAHVANWQLGCLAATRLGIPLTVIYTPASNPLVDLVVNRARGALGCELVDRDHSLRRLLKELHAGRSVGIVADHQVDQAEAIPYFGVPTPTTLIPARLALRFDCDLIPVRAERLGGSHFRMTFEEALRPEDPEAPSREQAVQLARAMNARFESWIRERPEQWVCVARQFPKQLPAGPHDAEAPGDTPALPPGSPSDIQMGLPHGSRGNDAPIR